MESHDRELLVALELSELQGIFQNEGLGEGLPFLASDCDEREGCWGGVLSGDRTRCSPEHGKGHFKNKVPRCAPRDPHATIHILQC
jgi:hypothetical protein